MDIQQKCPCNGSFLDKLTQPALLVMLSKGSGYGFQLIADLEKSGMVSGDSLDPAGLYRTLKRMEAAGLVRSFWDTESCAKPRRVYSITEEGQNCLSRWRTTLRNYRNNLDTILSRMDAE